MRGVSEHTVVCPFCGNPRTIRTVQDDGVDYMGHARGKVECYTEDDGCTCPFGRLEQGQYSIKKMCYNCKFYEGGSCDCEEMLKEVSSIFEMPEKLKIKHPERRCNHWSINLEIFRKLVNAE